MIAFILALASSAIEPEALTPYELAVDNYLWCIRATSQNLARSREAADVVAIAVTVRCADRVEPMHDAFMVKARSTPMNVDDAETLWRNQLVPKIESKGRSEAISYIVAARLNPPKHGNRR